MSDLSQSLMVAHFWWATWAICSQSLICLERPEPFAHSRSFVLSDLSESLTVASLIWAKWRNERWANERIPSPDMQYILYTRIHCAATLDTVSWIVNTSFIPGYTVLLYWIQYPGYSKLYILHIARYNQSGCNGIYPAFVLHISGPKTRHLPWYLLQLWQALFLREDSHYFWDSVHGFLYWTVKYSTPFHSSSTYRYEQSINWAGVISSNKHVRTFRQTEMSFLAIDLDIPSTKVSFLAIDLDISSTEVSYIDMLGTNTDMLASCIDILHTYIDRLQQPITD